MNNSQDDFSPLIIDQQIDAPEAFLSPEKARFLREVQVMFEQEKSTSIEQSWSRLVSQRAGSNQPPEILNLSTYRQQSERNSRVQNNTMSSTPAAILLKKRRMRWFGLLAAAVVCALLISSLAFVLAASRNKAPNTRAGSQNGGAKTHAASPTVTPPLTIPASCLDKLAIPDLADEVLCAKGQETVLNITKSITVNAYSPYGRVSGSGTLTVTFLRAYADTSRLILVYTINRAPGDWGGFVLLSTRQGVLSIHESCILRGFCIQSFDTSTLPANTTQLQVQGLSTMAGANFPLSFTLPLYTASKTIMVNQTDQNDGYSQTLKSVVITPSAVVFHFVSTPTPQAPGRPRVSVSGGMISAITINGQKQNINTGMQGSGSGNETGTTLEEQLYLSLLDQSGSWIVTVGADKSLDVFTFTVPA